MSHASETRTLAHNRKGAPRAVGFCCRCLSLFSSGATEPDKTSPSSTPQVARAFLPFPWAAQRRRLCRWYPQASLAAPERQQSAGAAQFHKRLQADMHCNDSNWVLIGLAIETWTRGDPPELQHSQKTPYLALWRPRYQMLTDMCSCLSSNTFGRANTGLCRRSNNGRQG